MTTYTEFSVSNPPCDIQPRDQYYEWKTEPKLGWWCKMCWKYMTPEHSNTDSHKMKIYWENENGAAKRMGYGSSGATGSSGFADQRPVPPPPRPFPSDPIVNPPAATSSINSGPPAATQTQSAHPAATQTQSHLIENLFDKQSNLIAQQLAATQKQAELIKEQSELIKNQSELMQEQAKQLVELTNKLSQIATDVAEIKGETKANGLAELTDKLSEIATDLADIKWNLSWW